MHSFFFQLNSRFPSGSYSGSSHSSAGTRSPTTDTSSVATSPNVTFRRKISHAKIPGKAWAVVYPRGSRDRVHLSR